jgi:hypothetical protein
MANSGTGRKAVFFHPVDPLAAGALPKDGVFKNYFSHIVINR